MIVLPKDVKYILINDIVPGFIPLLYNSNKLNSRKHELCINHFWANMQDFAYTYGLVRYYMSSAGYLVLTALFAFFEILLAFDDG